MMRARSAARGRKNRILPKRGATQAANGEVETKKSPRRKLARASSTGVRNSWVLGIDGLLAVFAYFKTREIAKLPTVIGAKPP